MLHLIIGRARSGKTTYVHNLIQDFIKSGQQDIILLVPEQYSFQTERAMLERLGPLDAGKVEVLSFSRLAHTVLRRRGLEGGQSLDDSARAVLMSLALESVQEQLEIYKKHCLNRALVKDMLSLCDEFKQGMVSPDDLMRERDALPDFLKRKVQEIVLVLNAYDALVKRSFYDEQDVLTRLSDTLVEFPFFEGRTVVVDAFRGFTAQELAILEHCFAQSLVTYVTLCTDVLSPLDDDMSVFAHTKRTAAKLMQAAKRRDVPIAKPWMLSGVNKYNNFPPKHKRYASPAIAALEENLYNPAAAVFKEATDDITIIAAEDIVSECAFVAARIKRLMREDGLRCRDIAVIARTADTYEAQLKSALKKCGVPVFIDKRQPILTQPLITLVRSALEIAVEGFSVDALMRCLKSGLTDMALDDIAELENYALIWNIHGSRWEQEWTMNPRGYGSEMTQDDREALKTINALRIRAVEPFQTLRAAFAQAETESAVTAVYTLLVKLHAGEHLKELAVALEEQGETAQALEQERLWDDLMQMLDTLVSALRGHRVTSRRLRDLFELILSMRTLGSIPQGLDEITIGSADRIRTSSPKVVFVVGVNEDVFPRNPQIKGILNGDERLLLLEQGLTVSDAGVYRVFEERLIAYETLCCASDKLFVSYARKDLKGGRMTASELIAQIKRLFPACVKLDTVDIPPAEYVEGERAAFELTAKLMRQGDELYAALRAYFETHGEYTDKLAALDRAAGSGVFEMRDKTLLGELFGKSIRMSPSRIEKYAKCPFSFFCEYTLKARVRKPAAVDVLQRGTMIHHALERLLKECGSKQIVAFDEECLSQEVTRIFDEYVDRFMGGKDDKPPEFLYRVRRLTENTCEVISRIARQLENSVFEPVAFEMNIDDGGDVPPYTLTLDDGTTLRLRGLVDRVDAMTVGDKKYICVVDYKTGGKKLEIGEVLEGINAQMLIYLFAIWANGQPKFGEVIPAGVFYEGVSPKDVTLDRHASAEEIRDAKDKRSALNGLLLKEDAVIHGLEVDGAGVRVTSTKGKESASAPEFTLEQLQKLRESLDKVLCRLCTQLREGRIEVSPVKIINTHLPCTYCDFSAVCGFEENDTPRTPTILDYKAVRSMLDEKAGEDQ